MNQHSFSFIMNPLLVSFRTPIEIMEGIVLRKAHDNEKTRIKNFLDSINAFHGPFVDMRVTNDSCVANTYVMDNIEENVEFGPSFISNEWC